MKGQYSGTNTAGMDVAAWRKKRMAKKRRREEREWAAKAGPVVVKKIDDTSADPATPTE